MRIISRTITGTDGSAADFTGYVIDTHRRMDPETTRPAVLILPGGGYAETSDREAEPIALTMVGMGYHAFVLRYSVAPSRHPVALAQAADAMRIIRDNASDWAVDRNSIAVMGFSAGGHLATNLCTEWNTTLPAELGFQADNIRPNALILAYPVISSGEFAHRGSFDNLLGELKNDENALESVSLEKRANADMPPTFIWHTVTDDDVPVENTLMLVSALKRHHVPVEAHLFPSGPHGLSLGTEETAIPECPEEECVQIWPDLLKTWLKRTLN